MRKLGQALCVAKHAVGSKDAGYRRTAISWRSALGAGFALWFISVVCFCKKANFIPTAR